jgi:hypothetical protein
MHADDIGIGTLERGRVKWRFALPPPALARANNLPSAASSAGSSSGSGGSALHEWRLHVEVFRDNVFRKKSS